MEEHQELQWAEAQQIKVNVDLVSASKQQLRFLATVNKNRCLYQGPTLLHAIYRYKFCWLPLLAKQAELGGFPLIAPLDCEWVWHCHRLNPLRYKADCEDLYGRVLDSSNVVSSTVEGASTKQTEEIWKLMYPNEPYLMDMINTSFRGGDLVSADKFSDSKTTNYDLVSAVKRQSTFFYQVSRPHMSNEEYLEGSIARYKAFLYLIKKNMNSNLANNFCVPTYDIDLIWHSHQLHPAAYCQDTMVVFGKVLDHDDTDSDRGEGTKLNVGFNETIRRWEEAFGSSYVRAGARYRGPEPSPLVVDPFVPRNGSKKMHMNCQEIVKLPKEFLVEVLMEIVGVQISPQNPGEKLFLHLSKKNDNKQKLKIPFDSKVKEVVAFQCEPYGKLIFELVSSSNTTKTLGTACLSLPQGKLSESLFLELVPPTEITSEKPMALHVSLSMTPPFSAPYALFLAPFMEAKESSRILVPQKKLELMDGSWMCVMDKVGKFVIGIKIKGGVKKELIGVSDVGQMQVLAQSDGFMWHLMDSEWSLHRSKEVSSHGKLYELTGERKVVFIPGRKLEYETQSFRTRRNEDGYMTVVEVSSENPNGKAIALFDFNSYALEIKEEWFLLPGIVSACVLSSAQKDLDKGEDLLARKTRGKKENLAVDGNEFMAHCSGSGGCGGGGACSGCRGGCQSGGCSSKCSSNCGN